VRCGKTLQATQRCLQQSNYYHLHPDQIRSLRKNNLDSFEVRLKFLKTDQWWSFDRVIKITSSITISNIKL
jgi:hypothetical protein